MADGAPNTGPFFFVELLLVVSFYEAMARIMRSTDLPVEGLASRHALG